MCATAPQITMAVDIPLMLYFAFWCEPTDPQSQPQCTRVKSRRRARRYVGNSFYNIQNKKALNATGGKHAGYGMTVATLQVRSTLITLSLRVPRSEAGALSE